MTAAARLRSASTWCCLLATSVGLAGAAARPVPRAAYRSALLGYGERWGRMVETQGKLFAAIGSAVVCLDQPTGRWAVLIDPGQHPHAKLWGVGAGKGAVYFAGARVEGEARRPLVWRIDVGGGFRPLPVEAALREAGLAEYDGVRDVAEAGGRLWLVVSRQDYEGPLLEYDPAKGAVAPAPPVPEGRVSVGWSDGLVVDGDAILAIGHINTGDHVLWRLDTRAHTWTHQRLPLRKGKPYLRARLLRRPGEWWGVGGDCSLVVADGKAARRIPPPPWAAGLECTGVGFVGERVLFFWGSAAGGKAVPFAYLTREDRWVAAEPFEDKEGFRGSWGSFAPSATGAWFVQNYTIYHFAAADLLARAQRPDAKKALADRFIGSWPVKTIEQVELEDLAQRRAMRSCGVAIIEADEAPVHDAKGGPVIRRIPFGRCVLVYKWFDGHGQLTGPGVKSLTPHPRMADPEGDKRRLGAWEPVLLADGTRGWMRGRDLIPWATPRMAAHPAGPEVTVHLSPRHDTAQRRRVAHGQPALVRDIVEIRPRDERAGEAELWVSLDAILAGNPPLGGWVSAREFRLDFAEVQRDAARYWSGLHGSLQWHGKTNDAARARRLLEWMAEEYKASTFLHHGIFDGGGPRVCHAGAQARFDLAELYGYRWKEPDKALAIYEALEREKTDAPAYRGTVPAEAAYQRARLLRWIKRYDEAIEAYHRVVTRHAGKFVPCGMYGLADAAALHEIRGVCLEHLKDPARWRKEAARLERDIADPELRKLLQRLRPAGN